jgi:hypothetical protein
VLGGVGRPFPTPADRSAPSLQARGGHEMHCLPDRHQVSDSATSEALRAVGLELGKSAVSDRSLTFRWFKCGSVGADRHSTRGRRIAFFALEIASSEDFPDARP